MKFLEPAQIQAALTTYMQDGVVKGFDSEIPASSGIVVLGNIEAEKFNTEVNMVDAINPIFRKAEMRVFDEHFPFNVKFSEDMDFCKPI